MKAHFVEFFSPGTFFAESSVLPIESWNVEKAKKMALKIVERYGATPYGFRFFTKERKSDELDSKRTKKSNMYYLGGRVETLAEVEARNDPKEDILRSNMRCNGWDTIVINDNSWRMTQPLEKDDVILDFKPPKRKAA